MTHPVQPADTPAPDELAKRCAAAMFETDNASRALGMEITDIGAGHATVRMTITDLMLNGHRIGHGGYTFMLADSAFAFACNSYDVATVAASCDIVFTAPTYEGDVLEAAAVQRHRAGRGGIYDVTVTRVNAEPAEVVAEFRGVSRSRPGSVLGRTTKSTECSDETALR
jgi:acyl-CoA thioesterase